MKNKWKQPRMTKSEIEFLKKLHQALKKYISDLKSKNELKIEDELKKRFDEFFQKIPRSKNWNNEKIYERKEEEFEIKTKSNFEILNENSRFEILKRVVLIPLIERLPNEYFDLKYSLLEKDGEMETTRVNISYCV